MKTQMTVGMVALLMTGSALATKLGPNEKVQVPHKYIAPHFQQKPTVDDLTRAQGVKAAKEQKDFEKFFADSKKKAKKKRVRTNKEIQKDVEAKIRRRPIARDGSAVVYRDVLQLNHRLQDLVAPSHGKSCSLGDDSSCVSKRVEDGKASGVFEKIGDALRSGKVPAQSTAEAAARAIKGKK